MIRTYNVELEVLTPVIINNGESYDFGEILTTEEKVIINNRDTNLPLPELYKFYANNKVNIFGEMDPENIKSFVNRAIPAIANRDNASLKALRQELALETGSKNKFSIRILGEAKKDLSDKPLQKVDKVAQAPIDMSTYIPGSSIKGALRTGFLEQLRSTKNIDPWKYVQGYNGYGKDQNLPKQKKINDAKNFEMQVMTGGYKFNVLEDPFKYIKVSDFLFSKEDAITYISKVGNDGKMPIYSAMTNSYVYSGKPVIAKGTISVDDKFFSAIKGLNTCSDLKDILKNIKKFYCNNLEPICEIASPLMNYIIQQKYLKQKDTSDAFIRLGHYVGIKNYTFKVKQVSPPQKHPDVDINTKGGRVVLLEHGIVPGMCMLKIKEED